MQKINKTKVLSSFLLIVCLVQASTANAVSSATTNSHSDDLKCYICENCAKITKQTPLEECDAEFFEKRSSSSTEAPDDGANTTNAPITTITETATTTTTTEHMSTELNTETTTTTVTTTTTEAMPTAPTVGPINTTTLVTPVNEGTVPTSSVFEVTETNATGNGDAPKAQPLVAEDYSYHCYSVQKNVNGSMSMERGCSRVSTMESVCGQLKALNMGVQLSKCVPCSNSECNGSSTVGVSVAALVFALVAALLSRQ